VSSQSGSRRKRIAKSDEETDVYGSWRSIYCYLKRPGSTTQVKKRTHRRERREGKIALRRGED
jgi:Zn/Cd-binding protein ZinT